MERKPRRTLDNLRLRLCDDVRLSCIREVTHDIRKIRRVSIEGFDGYNKKLGVKKGLGKWSCTVNNFLRGTTMGRAMRHSSHGSESLATRP